MTQDTTEYNTKNEIIQINLRLPKESLKIIRGKDLPWHLMTWFQSTEDLCETLN